MIQRDTVRLLRECDAGAQMGASAISDVLAKAASPALRRALTDCRAQHEELGVQIRCQLNCFHDRGKSPSPMVQAMSKMKTAARLSRRGSDAAVADLITDGCTMGVKSLNHYLNRYKAADERSKDMAKRLIRLEQKLTEEVRDFL